MSEEKASRGPNIRPEIVGREGKRRVKVQHPSGALTEQTLEPELKVPPGWTVQKVGEETVTFLDDQGRPVVRPKKGL